MLNIFASPREIVSCDTCYFYHTIDLPTVGTIRGDWDLRGDIDQYLGNIDLKGKRALDIGAANGMLSFSMEDKGAEVVSFDLADGADWDLVPYVKWGGYLATLNDYRDLLEKLKNAYWYAHRLKKSNAKAVYGNVYEIPEEIGPVDVSVFGCILLHLKNPFDALSSGVRITRQTVIVTDHVRPYLQSNLPAQIFMPDAKEFKIFDVWWYLNPEIIRKMLGILGFEDSSVEYHDAFFKGHKEQLYTVTANRTHDYPGTG